MRIDLLLLGFAEYVLEQDRAALVFEGLRRARVSPKAVKRYEKTGEIRVFCTLRDSHRINALSLPVTALRSGGVPVCACALAKRPGMLCGLLLAVLLVVAARLFVWEVRVEGNEEISAEELLGELSAAGLARGAFIPRLDGEAVALSLRRGDGRISYAAVNLRGTVANVQITEAILREELPTAPADIVAARDGVVVLPLIFEGEALVREGDVVRAGQILARGVVESEMTGSPSTRAAGQVWARTVHTYTAEVPFSYAQRTLTGQRRCEISLLFFGFRIKVFKNTGNLVEKCDIIQNIKWATLPNGRTLPFGIAVTEFFTYKESAATRGAAEARELAAEMLLDRIMSENQGRAILSRTVETAVSEESVRLICTLVCEEDIAVVREPRREERDLF